MSPSLRVMKALDEISRPEHNNECRELLSIYINIADGMVLFVGIDMNFIDRAASSFIQLLFINTDRYVSRQDIISCSKFIFSQHTQKGQTVFAFSAWTESRSFGRITVSCLPVKLKFFQKVLTDLIKRFSTRLYILLYVPQAISPVIMNYSISVLQVVQMSWKNKQKQYYNKF